MLNYTIFIILNQKNVLTIMYTDISNKEEPINADMKMFLPLLFITLKLTFNPNAAIAIASKIYAISTKIFV